MRNKNFITSPRGSRKSNKIQEFVTVALLGENHGYRMKSYGPIPLIQLEDGKTLIEKQINAVKSTFANFEIILCAGFETSKIVSFIKHKFKNIDIRVVENQVHYNSNCCESARLCLNNTMNDKIIFCGGGVLLYPSQLNMINLESSSVVVQNQHDDSNFEIGVINKRENLLERFSIGVRHKYWAEILYLRDQDTIDNFYKIVSHPEYKNKFLFEAINDLVRKSEIQIQNNVTNRPIRKIDNIKTLRKTTKL